MNFKCVFVLAVCLLPLKGYSQRNCGTPAYTSNVLSTYHSLSGRYGRSLGADMVREQIRSFTGKVTIPVAFHIVYKNDGQKISRELINKQVADMNRDFAGSNAILGSIPVNYRRLVADCEINFVVDTIFYCPTTVDMFTVNAGAYDPAKEAIKFTDRGGHNAMPSSKCLNVWVGNITDGSPYQLLGYATFPGGDGAYDGVVIYYKAFGPQELMPQFNKGRTLTHEAGHWLNLRHIWGDASCGDDLVQDTPSQDSANAGCPLCPHPSSCNGPDGDLLMDYMDYVDDGCMYMFTNGQKDRMRSLFLENGSRASIIQGVEENRIVLTTNSRLDTSTSTIANVTTTARETQITWDSIDNAAKYKVLIKKVKDNEWVETETTSNHINLKGLNSATLYEVKVQTVLANGAVAPESTPYIFSMHKDQLLKINRLRIK